MARPLGKAWLRHECQCRRDAAVCGEALVLRLVSRPGPPWSVALVPPARSPGSRLTGGTNEACFGETALALAEGATAESLHAVAEAELGALGESKGRRSALGESCCMWAGCGLLQGTVVIIGCGQSSSRLTEHLALC